MFGRETRYDKAEKVELEALIQKESELAELRDSVKSKFNEMNKEQGHNRSR